MHPIGTPEEARRRLLNDLSNQIAKSRHVMFTPEELRSKTNLTEEDWFERTCRFLEDPQNGFPNRGLVRDLVRGLLTKRFADKLGPLTVAKYATIVQDFPAPKRYKGV